MRPVEPARFLPSSIAPAALRRRELLALLGAGLTLAACGGQDDADVPPAAAKAVADAAASDTRPGTEGGALVGAAYGLVTADATRLAAAGVRKLGEPAALQATDAMMIGSNTKAMTAAIAGRLVAQGRIDWSTRIADAIPALGAAMLPAYAQVTLEQLLAHRGGLLAFTQGVDLDRFTTYLATCQGVLPGDEHGRRLFFLDWVLRQQPPAGIVPGRDYAYSNAGYALAGAMLEAVSGRAYEALWTSEIGQPLGLRAEWVRPELTGGPAAWGHSGAAGQVAVEPTPDAADQAWFDVIIPAGLITITPADYAAWLRWHVRALRGEPTPLAAGYVQRMKAIAQGDYAVGWAAAMLEGRPCLAHDGAWVGFMALAAVDAAGGGAVFGMTNTNWFADDGSSWVIARLNASVQAIARAAG